MSDIKDLYCLIMAGGSGTRFWPRSRGKNPKQFLKIFGDESLIQSTINRFATFTDTEKIFIVSSKSQQEMLEKQTVVLPKKNLIYEPVGKNTLPCIGLAALFAEKSNPDGIMVVSPSDHLIKNDELFRDSILAAADIANEKNGIVTIGITPSFPATGYGYIQVADEITGGKAIRQFKVDRFVEKPDEETASGYLQKGGFYWNGGIFVFKVSVFLNAVKEFAPDLYNSLLEIKADIGKPTFESTLDSVYRAVESISVDYGIMEKANNVYTVEGNFDWNDLGSWESVYQCDKKDEMGNASTGEVMFHNSNNSYVYSEDGVVAVVGLDDVIVVRDGNATLVCKRDKAEDIKAIVEKLKAQNRNEYL